MPPSLPTICIYVSCICYREIVKFDLKREYRDICSYTTPLTSRLFGDDLSKSVRKARQRSNLSLSKNYSGQKKRYRYKGKAPVKGMPK